ncbi:MAG: FHA domain-containing protein [Chloroflexi bacterium]|nr:FHA domain-containing protein [Chloroflexota bacterium]
MSAQPSEYPGENPAYFIIQKGPDAGREFSLEQSISSIGRSAANDIVLNDPEVSRHHARILRQGSIYSIEDLGSTNGTFVNNQRLTSPVPLSDGDLLGFGETIKAQFVRRQPAPPPVPDWDEPAAMPVVREAQTPAAPPETAVPETSSTTPASRVKPIVIISLILLILLCCFCGLLIVALDSYNQGQLLYCGGLRPFWETILGPAGFNPVCP